jgi:hypothetical protein
MITVGHNTIRIVTEPLEESLPPGMFAPDGASGAQNALRAFRIVEGIIRERSALNALTARLALLQSFPRLAEGAKREESPVVLDAPEFVRQYALALAPSWYAEYIAELSDDQVEILLKHALQAHETWGHAGGVGDLVRSMLEASAHAAVRVEVRPLEGEQRLIPKEQLSMLGRKENFAHIGKDFALGKTVFSRPERYEILVGPVSREILESFRREGWAEGSHPARKLERLAELAEPYYLRARIRFLLESTTSGFVLGQGILGTGALGCS